MLQGLGMLSYCNSRHRVYSALCCILDGCAEICIVATTRYHQHMQCYKQEGEELILWLLLTSKCISCITYWEYTQGIWIAVSGPKCLSCWMTIEASLWCACNCSFCSGRRCLTNITNSLDQVTKSSDQVDVCITAHCCLLHQIHVAWNRCAVILTQDGEILTAWCCPWHTQSLGLSRTAHHAKYRTVCLVWGGLGLWHKLRGKFGLAHPVMITVRSWPRLINH